MIIVFTFSFNTRSVCCCSY